MYYYDIQSNEELMLPLINATKSILGAALKEPRFKRIVLTSSLAAVVDRGCGPWPGHKYAATDWNLITYSEGVVGDPIAGYRARKEFGRRGVVRPRHVLPADGVRTHRAPRRPRRGPQRLERAAVVDDAAREAAADHARGLLGRRA